MFLKCYNFKFSNFVVGMNHFRGDEMNFEQDEWTEAEVTCFTNKTMSVLPFPFPNDYKFADGWPMLGFLAGDTRYKNK